MARFRLRYQATNLELRPGEEFAIGRSSACNLAVSDGMVSRKHALLLVEPKTVVLQDLGSRNGVAVNGVRIEGECPLQHMDRVYIGSQELVLIDADKMNERATTDRHIACEVCGAINGSAKRFCGDCGARLDSDASATWKEQDRGAKLSPSVDAPNREWGASENTHTARALDVLGSIASKAITMGRFDEAERILIPHLDALLERALRNRPLSDSNKDDPEAIFTTATSYAVQLAEGLLDKKWTDWVFRIHTATGRLMTAETIEAMHNVVRRQEYHRRKYVRAYLQTVQTRARSDYSPSERFLLGRLDGLAEVILAR
ncbi:MAG: FHA domain-containing protein [Polyangiales bacterium]